MTDEPKRTLVDGSEIYPGHNEHKPNGQQRGYVVLAEEERAKGFVRPVRTGYVHVGPPTKPTNLRDLTEDEQKNYGDEGYVKYQVYDPPRGSAIGRFWEQDELNRALFGGCGSLTKMSLPLAETYARDPHFYSGTFCAGCGKHFPVGQNGEFIWDDGSNERVGT